MQVPLEPATQEPLSGLDSLFMAWTRRCAYAYLRAPDMGWAHCDFGTFAHAARPVLGSAQPLAFVRDELFLDEVVCILRSVYSHRIRHELAVATFTHTEHRNIILSFHDSKLALRHA